MIKKYNEFNEGFLDKISGNIFNKLVKPKIRYYDNGQKMSELLYDWTGIKSYKLIYREWYENGQKKYEIWHLNNKAHREDGPSIRHWHENGQKISEHWYLNDKEYSREKWIDELRRIGSEHYEEQKMLYNAEKYNL